MVTRIDPLQPSLERLRTADRATQVREVGRHLASFFMKDLVEQMWRTVPDGGLIPKSNGERIFRGFLNDQLASGLARTLPLGARMNAGPADFRRPALQNGAEEADSHSGGRLA